MAIIVHIIKEEGCKDAAKWDQGSLMSKLMETLQEGYKLPDGVILDPLGVLEEEQSRHGVKNNKPQGVERLSDVDSLDPVRFLSDLKRGEEREADQIRVADVLRMKVELRGVVCTQEGVLAQWEAIDQMCTEEFSGLLDIGHVTQSRGSGCGVVGLELRKSLS
jgi:hypothetical protein